MIEWQVGGDHLRVADEGNAEVGIGGKDITVTESAASFPRPVDETLETEIRELQLPRGELVIESLATGRTHRIAGEDTRRELPRGEYLLELDASLVTYLRFAGSVTVRAAADGTRVSFPDETRVLLGFRSEHDLPTARVIVPNEFEGIARAIGLLASAHKTETADRSFPAFRSHPPLLKRGEEFATPTSFEEPPDSGIEVVVPPDHGALYVVAPLVYYTGARLRIGGQTVPRLRVPGAAIERELSPMPGLEESVERLLRKTVFLDSLVRNAGPHGTPLAEQTMLDALGFEAETLYDAGMGRRLATYLEVPYEAVEHRLPDWHLATYVEPSYEALETLPFLLDRMSLIFTPHTSELEGRELVRRSLDDFYRSRSGTVANVDIVKPELGPGRFHGWLSDGVPIDVFKSTPTAYRNQLRYRARPHDRTSISVVLNDPEMEGEQETVAEIYERRAQERPLDLTVRESASVEELATVFETPHDFVHYIGHCEEEGLRCPDGFLSTEEIGRSAVQTFFLNACGSFYEGMNLVEKGSVAGAVTFTTVLNDHAVKVGSTFARLLMHGYSIERAMSLARRRIMMGKDYAVVGDGTHSLTVGEHDPPMTAQIDTIDEERYLLSIDCYSMDSTGSHYRPVGFDTDLSYLCGNTAHFTLEEDALARFLSRTPVSVVFDGDLYWSEALASRFTEQVPSKTE